MRHHHRTQHADHGHPFAHAHRDEHIGPHRDHRGHARGRGGPGRFFDSGDLRYVILHLISDTPRHGYEIIKHIEALLGGAFAPSPGIIYPTLTLLEEMGSAAVSQEGSRKLYAITDHGRKELADKQTLVAAILQRMTQASQQHAQDRPAPVMRAMENLKLVLRMRAGNLSAEQQATVTDIIDNAAKQIERL